jgi:opacity protein-like surface antigen
MRKIIPVALASVAILGAASAHAQSTDVATGAYVGIAGGVANADFGAPSGVYRTTLVGPIAQSADERDAAWRAIAGYRFGRTFGVELSVGRLGEFEFVSRGTNSGRVTARVDMDAVTALAYAAWPLTPAWEVYTGAGVAVTRTRARAAATGGALFQVGERADRRLTEVLPDVQLGTRFRVRERWTTSLAVEAIPGVGATRGRNAMGDADVYSCHVALSYRF